MTGGKLDDKPTNEAASLVRLGDICDAYYGDQIDKASSTLAGERPHINHLKEVLGVNTRFASLDLDQMQDYVNRRRRAKNRLGGKISGTTIKKELRTFAQIWDWARARKYVAKLCPIKDPNNMRRWAVRVPKPRINEKFMTWGEIESRIARGGLSATEQKELWKYLFLDEQQVAELLKYVKEHATHPFIYPMFVFAAYAGARRSEICRSMMDDFKFQSNLLTIRERKKRKDLAGTTRDVPMDRKAKSVFQAWFRNHPGGQFSIAPPLKMARRKAKAVFDMLTRDEAHHHFKKTLKGSAWEVVRGFHVLRHSFGAICTRASVPMNVIAKWMGHTRKQVVVVEQAGAGTHFFSWRW